jgi:hypothetical protein
MPRGKERKLVLKRLGEDLGRIEKTLGYGRQPDVRKRRLGRLGRRSRTRGQTK